MGKNVSGNQKKAKKLGMSAGTARAVLVKAMLFEMAQKLDRDNCFRCSQKIEDVKVLSIDHKTPWLDSENPTETYFDLTNIAFSHLKCNIKIAVKRNRKARPGELWCYKCQSSMHPSAFRQSYQKRGYGGICTKCNVGEGRPSRRKRGLSY